MSQLRCWPLSTWNELICVYIFLHDKVRPMFESNAIRISVAVTKL